MNRGWGVFFVALLFTPFAFADAGLTYHGRLVKPDGQPVTESAVKFRIQVRTPGSEDCLLYEETHLRDLSGSQGVFAITLNDGTAAGVNTEPFTIDRLFRNRGTFTFDPSKCNGGSHTYVPQPTDGRKLAVSFNDGTFSPTDWESLPPQTIGFVPSATESLAVGGYGPESLLRVHDGGGDPASIPALTDTQYGTLLTLLNGVDWSKVGGKPPTYAPDAHTHPVSELTSGPGLYFTYQPDGAACGTGQVLKWTAAGRWECADDAGGAGSLTIDDASTSAKGVVRLATGSDTSAGLVVQADDPRLTDARTPSGDAGGDLDGTFPNPDVVKIRGAAVSSSTPQAGQVLAFSGGQWAPTNFGIASLKTSTGASQFASANCSSTQTLTWSSLTDTFVCASIAFPSETDPKVGANAVNALSKWNGSALVASVIVDDGGNVGIGTASPSEKLEVAGNVKANRLCIGSDCRGAWPSGGGSSSATVSAQASRTSSLANITNTWITVQWNGEIWDTSDIHDPAVNNDRLTVPAGESGKYLVLANIDAGAGSADVKIRKNGADVQTCTYHDHVCAFVLDLAAADYLQVQVRDIYDVSTLSTNSRFTLMKLASPTANVGTYLSDADADTKVEVERSADEDFIRLSTAGAERLTVASGGNIGVGTAAPAVSLDLGTKTDALALPKGTDGERPSSPASGMIRYNTTSSQFEGYSGSSWAALGTAGGGAIDVQIFTTDGTWTKPSSGTIANVQCWGGGGAGGRWNAAYGKMGGGGGGGYAVKEIPLASLPSSVAVTIGAGGSGRNTNGNGANGGQSTFGTYLTAYGGGGGVSGNGGGGGGPLGGGAGASPGEPLIAIGEATYQGSPGASGTFHGGGGGSWGAAGGSSIYGGGGGGGIAYDGSGATAGGSSMAGGNGGNASSGVAGNGGTPGGGGGASSNGTSGTGGAGLCIVKVM